MLQPLIKKALDFFRLANHQKPRPGFVGNISFLLLSLGMVAFIAQSGLVSEHQVHEPPSIHTEPAPLFSDDDLYFYRDTITKYLLSQHFNGSVLLARRGEIIFSRSFGVADFRHRTPLRPETPFQLASISKTFTATAVLMLQEQGLLDIDDAVADHIPEFPYEQITIRMLLTHTSGLQNYMWLVERYWKEELPPSNEDMLDLFIRHPRPLDFWPGRRFAYSNTGYAFLGLLIERVSGQPFADFMHHEIFAPLGMENTFVYNPRRPGEMTTDRAYGFRRWGRGHIVIPDVLHDGVMGDKGIYSNVHDLFLWDRAIAANRLLPEERWAEAFAHTLVGNHQRPVRYGMGWRIQQFMGQHVVHHPGRWNGFRTSLKRFVEEDATLILLNNNSRDITRLVEGLQNILFMQEILDDPSDITREDASEYEVIGGGSKDQTRQ